MIILDKKHFRDLKKF